MCSERDRCNIGSSATTGLPARIAVVELDLRVDADDVLEPA